MTLPFQQAVELLKAGEDLQLLTETLLGHLTPQEKLHLLDGDLPFWEGMADMFGKGYNTTPIPMGTIPRLGIPGLRFTDGPRGVVVGESTTFPVSMARGATWDTRLEERVGTAIGLEARAQGANFYGGVCINLPRHPAWGRAQETYGEDPILLGAFGAALTRGVQKNVMAVAKHYALNSMENARFKVNVTASEATLHEVYLPHFREVVEAGVMGIMTSYNSVNGTWAGQNEPLLEGILRKQWGFQGITVSDFVFGFRDAAESLRAGLDVEEPFQQQRAQHLKKDLAEGRASWEHVDRAARRILSTQLHYYASQDETEPDASVVFCEQHRAFSREVAARSMVLLKNEPVDGEKVLPLSPAHLGSLAVIGRLADMASTGDHGSSKVRSPEVITPLQGLRRALPEVTLTPFAEDDPGGAASVASQTDVAVVIVGYTAEDEGEYISSDIFQDPALQALFPPIEGSVAGQQLAGMLLPAPGKSSTGSNPGTGGDRVSLRLRPVDVEIIHAVAAANPRTVVVVVTAAAVLTEEWRHAVPAVLVCWYAGSEGGDALADVLLGKVDTSGRLPFSIPTSESHLPFFERNATQITYDRWFGQRLLDRDGHQAAFPLGFGLSYTTFELSKFQWAGMEGEKIHVTVQVSNTGSRKGWHVVQLYGIVEAKDFPRRVLLGFQPVELNPGQALRVEVVGSKRPLMRWTPEGFEPAASWFMVEVASHAGDPHALASHPVIF